MSDTVANRAVWLDGKGQPPRIDAAPDYEPTEGQLLIRTKAVPVQPGEWKIQAGLIPIPLTYPTIIGVSISGVVEKIGPGVTRFAVGDRVASNTAGVVRDDSRFGAYQRYTLVPQELTSKIADTAFEDAASIITGYSAMSALFFHLGLDRPASETVTGASKGPVLIWGVSSSFGSVSSQFAHDAGYKVVGVASGRHRELALSAGVAEFVDRTSPTAIRELVALGPFTAVLAAADSAEDQVNIGEILAAQGGGTFLTTMGVREGVKLPEGVTGYFRQFLDDYLDPKNKEFTRWVWWDYLEQAFREGKLKSVPLEILGGLNEVPRAWELLRSGDVSGKRLIIMPGRD